MEIFLFLSWKLSAAGLDSAVPQACQISQQTIAQSGWNGGQKPVRRWVPI